MLCNCRCVYYLSPPAYVITIAWESHRPLEFSTDSHYRCSSSPPVFMTCVDHFPLAWRTPLGISLTASMLVRNYFLFVPLKMRVMLDEYFCSAYNYFLLAVWYIISFWCLASIISVEKSISLIVSPSKVICLFFFLVWSILRFPMFGFLSRFIQICFSVYFFSFILLGIHQASWLCDLISLTNFGKFSA